MVSYNTPTFALLIGRYVNRHINSQQTRIKFKQFVLIFPNVTDLQLMQLLRVT